jgi:hypothetical protein
MYSPPIRPITTSFRALYTIEIFNTQRMKATLTVNNGRPNPTPRPSYNYLSAYSSSQFLINARHTLLKTQTSDPRSSFVYDRTNRHSGHISPTSPSSCSADFLQRPYPAALPSLGSISRAAQRARVGSPAHRLKPSKPVKLWRSHVRLLAEQQLADDEAEELVKELEQATKDGDLEGIRLLMGQIDELANGICKRRLEKGKLVGKEQEQRGTREAARSVSPMVDFVRRLVLIFDIPPYMHLQASYD